MFYKSIFREETLTDAKTVTDGARYQRVYALAFSFAQSYSSPAHLANTFS